MSSTLTQSPFSQIDLAPPDPILGLTEAFVADQNPNKINLGVGVYQDANGKVPTLRAVQQAEEQWVAKEDTKTYLPIDGVAAYNMAVQGLLFGPESELLREGRAVTIQALGGTGALKVGADFLKRFFPESRVYISTPSWENHRALFEAAGLEVLEYPYYSAATNSVDFEAMIDSIRKVPARSIVLLHACCHNPTGVDLSESQWDEVVAAVQTRDLIPFLDFAYQGFGAGLEEDAYAIRAFAQAGIQSLIANSFSKSFSLYRERIGALTVTTESAEESKRVLSQIKRIVRTNYSSPSSFGGQVVNLILSDAKLRQEWSAELTEMRMRIHSMRDRFVEGLAEKGVGVDFSFIQRQRGMFSYSGIATEVVRRLRSEHSLYILDTGRICVAAMNDRNIERICQAIATELGR